MSNIESPRDRCPSCGQLLPAGTPPGQCTPCLLRLALLPQSLEDRDDDEIPAAAVANDETRMPSAPGPFGDYELIETIGRGAMGIVFKARQPGLDRLVALKVLDTASDLPPDAARRFRTEASAAAALRHPGIVTIHEVGVQQGRHYLAMDLIDGPTLAASVARQPLTATRTAQLVAAIADAVQCAHEHGILHRDLKPSNILVDAAGQPHVADFGLAKRMSADADLTLPGQVMGSPNFMSPEQARGAKLGPPSDVHALGAILFFCLAGRPPFIGQSIPDTLHQVAYGDPVPLRLLVAGVPRDLETITQKCLEKEPAKRYPDARALAADLRRFLAHEPIAARPVSRAERVWRWYRRRPAVAALATATVMLVLTLAVGSTVAAFRIRAERERAEDNLYAADMNLAQQALTRSVRSQTRVLLERHRPGSGERDRRGFEWRYLWSHSESDERELFAIPGSGRQIVPIPGTALLATVNGVWDTGPPAREVFTLPGDLRARVYDHVGKVLLVSGDSGLQAWSSETAQLSPILAGEAVHVVVLSPDGRWMASGGEKLRLWARVGNAWQEVASRPRVFKVWHNEQMLAFAPDGALLVSGTGETWANRCVLECWSVPALAELPPPADAPRDALSVAFSPDGRHLLAGCWSGEIRVWDAGTRTPVASTMQHFGFVVSLAFSPDDPAVFASIASDSTVRLWNLRRGTELVALQGPTDQIWAMAFRPDGRTLLTLEQSGRVAEWDAATRRRREVLIERGPCTLPLGFSHDSGTLVTIDETGRLRSWDVHQGREIDGTAWTVDLTGVFTRDFEVIAPAISPGLDRLAIGMVDGRVQLWDLRTRSLRVWIAHLRQLRNVAFSPDGRVLATIADDGLLRLWDPATGAALAEAGVPGDPVAGDFNVPLVWSSDGRFIAVGTTNVITLHDSRDARLLHRRDAGAHVYSMRFTADSRFLVSAEDNMQLVFWDPWSGELVDRVQSSHHEGIYDLCFSPDGRTLVSVVDDVKLWSLATRQEVSTLRGHERNIFATLFSPDGNTIVTADYGGAVRLWSARPFAAIDGQGR